MLTVSQARQQILAGASLLEPEWVRLEDGHGRILASDLTARLSQPPFRASAMDGYALNSSGLAPGIALRLVGQSAAGHAYGKPLGVGEAIRIFTGAAVPAQADRVIPQEEADASGGTVSFSAVPASRFIRPHGLDFKEGEALLKAGTRLTAPAIGLAAAANHRLLPVLRRPRIAILATGDEIVPPGAARRDGQIHSSSLYSVRACCLEAGADVVVLGIAPDKRQALAERVAAAAAIPADIVLTLGGASVGEHDLVRTIFEEAGGALDFWRILMRPGKPLLYGRLGGMRVVGLPGNPVSSFVCCWLFVLPLVRALQGLDPAPLTLPAILAEALPANDEREDYLRAVFSFRPDGKLTAKAFPQQDSSMQRLLAMSDGLLLRPPGAPAAKAGEACTILPFSDRFIPTA